MCGVWVTLHNFLKCTGSPFCFYFFCFGFVWWSFIVASFAIVCWWWGYTRSRGPYPSPAAGAFGPRPAACCEVRAMRDGECRSVLLLYHCGVPPINIRYIIDAGWCRAEVSHRCAQFGDRSSCVVTAAMAGRAGQVRKYFDLFSFVHSRAGTGVGRRLLNPDDEFDWLCYLDTQENGTKLLHECLCPGIGTLDEDACAPGATRGKQYAAAFHQKGFVSKLCMAIKSL